MNKTEATNSQVPGERIPRLIFIGGGVRSGKSTFALDLARQLGSRRTFVATAEAKDQEMLDRIARHRAERGRTFATIEAPLNLPEALEGIIDADVVIIDCLTLWLSNMLVAGQHAQRIFERVDMLLETVRSRPFYTLIITNEVGMGIVPESELGRAFRDIAGHVHQRVASRAQQLYFALLGVILRLYPSPVQVVDRPLSSESA